MTLDFSLQEKLVGGFVLLVLAVLLGAMGMIAQGKNWLAKHNAYYVVFDDGYNLAVGSKVKLLGHDIGEVRSLELTDDNLVRVNIRVLAHYGKRIRSDSWATVRAASLIAGEYLAIKAGGREAKPIAPGGRIPAREAVLLTTLIEEAAEGIDFARMGRAIDNLSGLAGRLSDPKGPLFSSLDDLRSLVVQVKSGQGTVGKLLADDELYRRLSSRMDQAEAILATLQKAAAQTARLDQAFGSVERILARVEAAAKVLDKTMAQMPAMAMAARESLTKVNQVLDSVRANFLIRGGLPPAPAAQGHGSEVRGN